MMHCSKALDRVALHNVASLQYTFKCYAETNQISCSSIHHTQSVCSLCNSPVYIMLYVLYNICSASPNLTVLK